MAGRTEGYFFRNNLYLSRREFCSHDDALTFKPDFISTTPRMRLRSQSLQESIIQFFKGLDTGREIHVLYSGGIDSEIALVSALKANLNVVPVIVDLFGMNAYEMQFARSFLRDYQINNFLHAEVSESEFQRKWLPELISDTESLSYLLSGAYIAARSCPPGATIVQSGENPNVLYHRNGTLLQMRHEYSLWTNKMRARSNLDIHDLYSDPQVLRSYIQYPAIAERLHSGVPYGEWFADNEYLGKEYLYTDPDFKNLKRRYSQHGWEAKKGAKGYTKDMVPFLNPYSESGRKKSRPYITDEMALDFLLYSLQTDQVDHERAYDSIFLGKKIGASIQSNIPIQSKDFNRIFYSYLGHATQNLDLFDREQTLVTSHEGEVISQI